MVRLTITLLMHDQVLDRSQQCRRGWRIGTHLEDTPEDARFIRSDRTWFPKSPGHSRFTWDAQSRILAV